MRGESVGRTERVWDFIKRVSPRFSDQEEAESLLNDITGQLYDKSRMGRLPLHNQISYLKWIVRTCGFYYGQRDLMTFRMSGEPDVASLRYIRNRVRDNPEGVLKLRFYEVYEKVAKYTESHGSPPPLWNFVRFNLSSLIDKEAKEMLAHDRASTVKTVVRNAVSDKLRYEDQFET